jgi:hypothetical protein
MDRLRLLRRGNDFRLNGDGDGLRRNADLIVARLVPQRAFEFHGSGTGRGANVPFGKNNRVTSVKRDRFVRPRHLRGRAFWIDDAVDHDGADRRQCQRGRDQTLGIGGIGVDVPVLGHINNDRDTERRVRSQFIDRQQRRDAGLALWRAHLRFASWRREQNHRKRDRE